MQGRRGTMTYYTKSAPPPSVTSPRGNPNGVVLGDVSAHNELKKTEAKPKFAKVKFTTKDGKEVNFQRKGGKGKFKKKRS